MRSFDTSIGAWPGKFKNLLASICRLHFGQRLGKEDSAHRRALCTWAALGCKPISNSGEGVAIALLVRPKNRSFRADRFALT